MKVRSRNTLLRTLMVGIRSYLKSVLRYRFLIFNTYHPSTPYLREQGCDDAWLFFEAKRSPQAKEFGKQ